MIPLIFHRDRVPLNHLEGLITTFTMLNLEETSKTQLIEWMPL